MRAWALDLSSSGYVPVASCCDSANIKYEECIDELSDY
jgi:hypothetical protein